MNTNLILNNRYLDILKGIVHAPVDSSCDRLFRILGSIEFVWPAELDRDACRASDGLELRRNYIYDTQPCSFLEMLVALSCKCEYNYMADPISGIDVGRWFWLMVNNMQLDRDNVRAHDDGYILYRVSIVLNRQYAPNGVGGLFVVNHSNVDLRNVEIWTQMCLYLDELVEIDNYEY